MLDAGCGTGHFAQSLINIGIGKMTLLDASSEMLTVAKENLNDAITKNVVDAVVTAKLPKLPFAEETFDVVLFFNVS